MAKVKEGGLIDLWSIGGVHAVPSQRPVHPGGSGVEFYVHGGWPGLHHPGPNQLADTAQTQPHPPHQPRLRLHRHLLLHHVDFHAHETAVSSSSFYS